MSAARLPLLIEQGVSWSHTLDLTTDAGVPINLTGYTARMQIRKTIDTSAFILELTTANGRIAINGPAGSIALSIAEADTRALPVTPGVREPHELGVYDLEIIAPGGTVERLVEGVVQIAPEVTR